MNCVNAMRFNDISSSTQMFQSKTGSTNNWEHVRTLIQRIRSTGSVRSAGVGIGTGVGTGAGGVTGSGCLLA